VWFWGFQLLQQGQTCALGKDVAFVEEHVKTGRTDEDVVVFTVGQNSYIRTPQGSLMSEAILEH
jgi:hypothetical protein